MAEGQEVEAQNITLRNREEKSEASDSYDHHGPIIERRYMIENQNI